jgi:cystathionine beta-lyase/cystathionine gamma-synthase
MENKINPEQRIPPETVVTNDSPFSYGAVSPPIYQSSLFTFDSIESMDQRFRGETSNPLYSRVDNPTVFELEQKIAYLENGAVAKAFSSGMGAISNAVLSQLKSGDRIVCVRNVYPDTYRLFLKMFPRFDIQTEFVDGTDLEAMEKALPGARILYLESPTSIVFEQQNLTAMANLAKKYGVTSIIDNSWATPIFQQPLDYGIDMVVHSASKYISGHSDTVAGIVIGNKEIIQNMNDYIMPFLGAKLAPFEAWLLLRGLRTLPIRMKQHHKNGLSIAKKLIAHESVKNIFHPGFNENRFVAEKSGSLKGFSSLFSIELEKDIDVTMFCNHLKLFKLAVSWGGYESLVFPLEVGMRQEGSFVSSVDFGLSPQIVRLHIGLENIDDLESDLISAIEASRKNK